MRRKDREVTDPLRIRRIVEAATCCHLGFRDGDGAVYIVPMHFGYAEEAGRFTFYFHSASEGRKISLIAKEPHVGFELDVNQTLLPGPDACDYSSAYQSMIGDGDIVFLTQPEEKRQALLRIMAHYTKKNDWTFSESVLNRVCVFRLDVRTFSCKEHLPPSAGT